MMVVSCQEGAGHALNLVLSKAASALNHSILPQRIGYSTYKWGPVKEIKSLGTRGLQRP